MQTILGTQVNTFDVMVNFKRFFKDNTLVNQDYIKDNKISVAAYVKSAGNAEVTAFARVALV